MAGEQQNEWYRGRMEHKRQRPQRGPRRGRGGAPDAGRDSSIQAGRRPANAAKSAASAFFFSSASSATGAASPGRLRLAGGLDGGHRGRRARGRRGFPALGLLALLGFSHLAVGDHGAGGGQHVNVLPARPEQRVRVLLGGRGLQWGEGRGGEGSEGGRLGRRRGHNPGHSVTGQTMPRRRSLKRPLKGAPLQPPSRVSSPPRRSGPRPTPRAPRRHSPRRRSRGPRGTCPAPGRAPEQGGEERRGRTVLS